MTRLETIINNELAGPSAALLGQSWRAVVLETIADATFKRIDIKQAIIHSNWDGLDDLHYRTSLLQNEHGLLLQRCAERISAQRKALDGAILAGGLHLPSHAQLRKSLSTLLPNLLPTSSLFAVNNPYPDAWKILANTIGIQIHQEESSKTTVPEWQRLNQLLLAGFFEACVLPKASLARIVLEETGQTLLGIRGSLLRIPANLAQTGIRDEPLPLSSRASPTRLSHTHWSELQGHIAHETHQVAAGYGAVHQVLNINRPPPASKTVSPTQSQMVAFRDARYREYEYSILAYMALSAIEQTLRGWAEHLGVGHMSSGRPTSLPLWVDQLGGSPALKAKIDILYGASPKPSLRNRVMHGGLLELESKRAEGIWSIAHTQRLIENLPPVQVASDPFSMENVFKTCIDCLETIDNDFISKKISLTQKDRAWESGIALSHDEIKFGLSVHCDFLTSTTEAETFRRNLSEYLRAVAPAFKQSFAIGFHGWISPTQSNIKFVQHMYLGLVFEGLYRLTAHLMGFPILQHSLSGSEARFQYQMLDEKGLLRPSFLNALLEHLTEGERATASSVLKLAIKARNALAHGAVPALDKRRWRGEGHIFVKSIQLLRDAGLSHMTREGAYYNWLNRGAPYPGSSAVDWEVAENQMYSRISSLARR